MKVVYSRRALAQLDRILSDIKMKSPCGAERVRAHVEAAVQRIATLPEGAQEIAQRPGVHRVPLVRHPYSIYYEIVRDQITILRIRHDGRQSWWEQR